MAAGLPRVGVVMSVSGSISGERVRKCKLHQVPLPAPPPQAEVRAAVADSILIGWPQDEITAGITTTVVMVVAKLSPHDAWRQPILRLADTAIGVTVRLLWPPGSP